MRHSSHQWDWFRVLAVVPPVYVGQKLELDGGSVEVIGDVR